MKKFVLVLGGGASKGYAGIGVLKVLEENGYIPDMIVGTSMGAMVGGMYAAGKTVDEMKSAALSLTKLGNFSIRSLLRDGNILNTEGVKKIVFDLLGKTSHDELGIKFLSIATDVQTGELTILDKGLVRDSIMASISVPAIFPAYKIGRHSYWDGGLVNNLADDIARALEPKAKIISVDVIGAYKDQVETSKIKLLESLVNASTIMTTRIVSMKPNCSDLRMTISQPDVSQFDFSQDQVLRAISNGEQAAKAHLDEIKALLGKRKNQAHLSPPESKRVKEENPEPSTSKTAKPNQDKVDSKEKSKNKKSIMG